MQYTCIYIYFVGLLCDHLCIVCMLQLVEKAEAREKERLKAEEKKVNIIFLCL